MSEAAIKKAADELRALTDSRGCDLFKILKIAVAYLEAMNGPHTLENALSGVDCGEDLKEVLLACMVAAQALVAAGPGACRVVQERVLQVEGGHTAERDDRLEKESLARTAAYYANPDGYVKHRAASPGIKVETKFNLHELLFPKSWPKEAGKKIHYDRKKQLVIAGWTGRGRPSR